MTPEEIEHEMRRPDGVIEVAPGDMATWPTTVSQATPDIRRAAMSNQPDNWWIEQRFVVTTYRGGKAYSVEEEWRPIPLVLKD